MKPIAIVNNSTSNLLDILYTITTTCNYDCHYCAPSSKDAKHRFPDYALLIKNLDHLLTVYKKRKSKIRINLAGGETTLWPKLGEFVQWCKTTHDCNVVMASNGSRTLRWWREYAKYFDDIQISVHREFCDIEHIKQVLDIIYAEENVMVAAQVLMDPAAWDDSLNLINELIAHPTPWLVKSRVVMDINDKHIHPGYTEEQLSYFKNKIKKMPPEEYVQRMKTLGKIHNPLKEDTRILFNDGHYEDYSAFKVWSNEWHKFYGWECNLGVDRLVIQADGYLIGSCGVGYLFNQTQPLCLFDTDFASKFNEDMVAPIKCQEIFCSGCSSDLELTKKCIT